jgi:hypothetical protein
MTLVYGVRLEYAGIDSRVFLSILFHPPVLLIISNAIDV